MNDEQAFEKWGTIADFSKYEISSLGRVKSIERFVRHPRGGLRKLSARIISQHISEFGYARCNIYDDTGKSKFLCVHKLVLMAFSSILPGKTQGNHINGNKLDNRLDNLEWVNGSENTLHAYNSGLAKKYYGEQNANSKLSNIEREFVIKSQLSSRVLAEKFNVSSRLIRHVRSRNKHKDVL